METVIKQLRKSSNSHVYNALVSLRTTHLRDKQEANLVKFREFGGLQSLICIIQRPNHKIVDLALSILGNCCLENETRKIVGRLQGVQHIVKILECLEKESLLNRACRTLANLALDDQIADEIMKSKAVHLIVQLLDKDTTTDTNLKQSAVRTLRILSSNNEKQRKEIVSEGAVRTLAKILKDDKDETLIDCILKAIVVMTTDCSVACAEQLQSNDCFQKLVTLSACENRSLQDGSLHVLANASKQPLLRPLIGIAGGIKSLVARIDKWEKTSNGWQWAVDTFCQCTRESINRNKASEEGGLKHLVSLLKEPIEERLWLCSLSSMISFFYDESYFSDLVDLGMIPALIDKLASLTDKEKPSEHGIPNILPVETFLSNEPYSRLFEDEITHRLPIPAQSSPQPFCYSPDSSPPYFTSFPSCSSPTFQRMSPCSFSPLRETSPLPLQSNVELCYSPVYESSDSDDDRDDDGDVDEESKDSVADGRVTTPSIDMVTSIIENANVGPSVSGNQRSPIGDILLLLSRLSFESKPRPCFVSRRTLTVLVDYVVTVGSPQLRAKRILSRVVRNPLSFERLVLLRMPELFRERLVLVPHNTEECSACETIEVYGHSLVSDLRFQAESPFGSGVLHHLILSGRDQEEKLAALLAAAFLVRSTKVQQQLLLDADGLTILTGIVGDVEHPHYDAVVRGIVHLAQIILSGDTDPNSDEPSEFGSGAERVCCLYEGSFKGEDGDIVRLSVDGDRDDHVLAHRSVLSRGCDVFNAMLCGSFVESKLETVSMQDTSYEALEYVVHCIYSCCSHSCPILRIDDTNGTARLLQALTLSDKLLLSHVKDTVVSCLINRLAQMTDAECVDAFVSSKIYDCPRLSSSIVRDTLTAKRFADDGVRIRRISELATKCEQFTVDAWKLIAYGISTVT